MGQSMQRNFTRAFAMTVAALAFGSATAAAAELGVRDRERTVTGPNQAAADQGRYGSLVAPGYLYYGDEIRLRPDTKTVTVRRLDIVKFVTAEGREFVWRFDTIRAADVFPLDRIAPAGVAVPPGVTVWVNPEIPVAP